MGRTTKRTRQDNSIKNKNVRKGFHRSDRACVKKYLQKEEDLPDYYEPREKY